MPGWDDFSIYVALSIRHLRYIHGATLKQKRHNNTLQPTILRASDVGCVRKLYATLLDTRERKFAILFRRTIVADVVQGIIVGGVPGVAILDGKYSVPPVVEVK